METGETHLLLFTAQMDTLYFVNKKKNYHDFFRKGEGGIQSGASVMQITILNIKNILKCNQ